MTTHDISRVEVWGKDFISKLSFHKMFFEICILKNSVFLKSDLFVTPMPTPSTWGQLANIGNMHTLDKFIVDGVVAKESNPSLSWDNNSQLHHWVTDCSRAQITQITALYQNENATRERRINKDGMKGYTWYARRRLTRLPRYNMPKRRQLAVSIKQ
jgi:hypothetical protein